MKDQKETVFQKHEQLIKNAKKLRKQNVWGNKKQTPNSITKVNFSEPEDSPYYRNKRSVHAFRCDDGIWESLVPVLKRNYGSVCRGIEVFGVAILHNNNEKVNICNTVNPLTINQTVVREMRARRKLEFEEEVEVVERIVTCVVCGRPVYALVTRADESRVGLCMRHFRDERKHLSSWRYVSEVTV